MILIKYLMISNEILIYGIIFHIINNYRTLIQYLINFTTMRYWIHSINQSINQINKFNPVNWKVQETNQTNQLRLRFRLAHHRPALRDFYILLFLGPDTWSIPKNKYDPNIFDPKNTLISPHQPWWWRVWQSPTLELIKQK